MKDGLYYADLLKNKKLQQSELIALMKQKIQDQQVLNAFVTLEQTPTATDVQPQQSELFAGLPIPLKILGQNKAGWLATSSSRLFKEQRATVTNHFVRALEKSGLTPFGQTNAPEFGFKNVTDPVLYGATRNPWNLDYSPGGSSGGAAASVAAGIFPIAGASDGGGSIRIPASFCGLIGLKPTRGTIPTGPDGWRDWQGAAINFALTVSMRDTKTLFYALRGQHPAAPYQAPKVEWQAPEVMSRPLKIAVCLTSPVGTKVSAAAVAAVNEAVDFLAAAGHTVKEIHYPLDGKSLIGSYYQMNGAETAAMFQTIQTNLQRTVTKSDMELMSWGIYQSGLKLSAAEYSIALQKWDQAAFVMEELFNEFDLFLSPTTAFPAPKLATDLQSDSIRQQLTRAEELSAAACEDLIYAMFEKSLTLTPYTQLANLTGQPAISLPTYVTKEHLPLGIQFMAAKGREDLLFTIGELFETAGKFKLPKAYQN
ncbi:amidase [Enterococcus sp. CSURQ0835]|uniref:amidase n=1 Tax=Enterococcus sp. CSURQ0835 TaxID=2681394 RepID=UPI0013591E32|nr:amidase [Enterococcus sp. CSURQ0835]